MVIDYKNQEQMQELGFSINKEYGRVFVSVNGDYDGVTFRNFPTITTNDTDFTNCVFEDIQAIEFSQAYVKKCTFRNVSEVNGHFTDFSECLFVQCCSSGPLLAIDFAGSIEQCTFKSITALSNDGYVIYSIYGGKKYVRKIRDCKFIDCKTESIDGKLTYCCYHKPFSSCKTVEVSNLEL